MNRFSGHLARLIVPGLLVLTAAFGVRCVYDWDVWWHLRTGQWIVENRAVPRTDPFSASAAGTEWIDLHWLFQLGLFGLHRASGWWGPTLLQAGLAAATIAVLVAAIGGAHVARRHVLVLLAAVLLLQTRLQMRPEVVSFLFLATTILAIDRISREGTNWPCAWRWLILLGVIQILWTNCHSLFVLGPIIGASFALGSALDAVLHRPVNDPMSARQRLVLAGLVPVAQFAAAMVNPYGWKGLTFPVQVFTRISGTRPEFTEEISEFHPTLTLLPFSWAAWLFLALLAGGLFSMIRSRALMPAWRFILFLAFAYLGLKAQRNMSLFAVAAAAVICQNTRDRPRGRVVPREPSRSKKSAEWSSKLPHGPQPSPVVSAESSGAETMMTISSWKLALDAGAIVVVMLLLGSGWLYRWFRMETSFGVGLMPSRFPESMAERLAAEGSEVVVFPLHIGYGNLFLWRGFPAVRSFMDGRLEVHESVFPTYLEIRGDFATTPARALARLRAAGVTHVAVPYGLAGELAVMQQLQRQPGVTLRFVDGTGALFGLSPSEAIDPECVGLDEPVECDLMEPSEIGRLARLSRVLRANPPGQAMLHLRTVAILLHVFDAPGAAVRQLVRAGTADPGSPYLWVNLAEAYRRLEKTEAVDPWTSALRHAQAEHADATFRALTKRDASPVGFEEVFREDSMNFGPLRSPLALLVRGKYSSSRRELREIIDSSTLDEDGQYRARWLLALIAKDLGDRERLVLELGALIGQEAPAEAAGIRELAEQELQRVERSCH